MGLRKSPSKTAKMNQFTHNQLKILVEQAVRPLKLIPPRKRKIREELLAQVKNWYSEEISKLRDQPAALEETRKRFGDPAILTAKLRKSVTCLKLIEWLVFRFPFLRPGDSTVPSAVRQIFEAGILCGTATLIGFIFALVLVLFIAPTVHGGEVIFLMGVSALIFLGLFIVSSMVIMLAYAMWHSLYGPAGPSWLRLGLLTVASLLVAPSAKFACYFALSIRTNGEISVDVNSALVQALRVLPACAGLAPYSLLFLLNLRWRLLYGPPGRSWQRSILVDSAWCCAVSMLIFSLALAISGEYHTGLENMYIIVLVTAFYLIPLDLIFSAPKVVAKIRSDQDWENLQLSS
jgi:hypothetical protein